MYRLEDLRTILQSIQFGMIIVGRDRRIRMVNQTALRMMGFESDSGVVGSVCHHNICPAEMGKCPILDLGQRVDLSEKVLLDRNGDRIPILKTVSAIELDGEEVLLETFVDITQRKMAEREAESARNFLQTVVDGVAEPVMVFGFDHRVTLMNRASREFSFGREKGPGGLMCYQVSHHRDEPCSSGSGHPCPLERVRDTGRLVTVVHEHCQPDGERRFVEIMAAPLMGTDGKPEAVVETSRDITERINIERQRADLFAMVTHDLKSPLSSILGYAELIMTGKASGLDPETLDMVDGIQRSGKKLLWMVDDYLTLSRMEAGRLALDVFPVDIAGLLAETAKEFETQAQQRGLTLKAELPEKLYATADRRLLLRAVSNLVQNALNYTPAGGTVELKAARAMEGGGEFAVVSVSDTGPGIAEEEQARVFEKYYRSPKTSGIKGSGLGLAIVKAVVDAHGGKVELKSAVGKGSVFSLFLPAAR